MAAPSYKTVRRQPILTGMAIRASRRMLARNALPCQAAILRATAAAPLMAAAMAPTDMAEDPMAMAGGRLIDMAADRAMVMAMDMPDIVAIIMNGMKAGKICSRKCSSSVARVIVTIPDLLSAMSRQNF